MRKKFFKEHTTIIHGKNVHPKKRHDTSGQAKLSFGKRPAKGYVDEDNHNIPKKNILDRDIIRCKLCTSEQDIKYHTQKKSKN